MASENSFINLPLADMFDFESMDLGSDLPILSLAEMEMEFKPNPPGSIMNRPTNIASSINEEENQKQPDKNERKHKLNSVDLCSPPKKTRGHLSPNSSMDSPSDIDENIFNPFATYLEPFEEPWIPKNAKNPVLSGHTAFFNDRPICEEITDNALDLNHTVTNHDQNSEQVMHIELLKEDCLVNKTLSSLEDLDNPMPSTSRTNNSVASTTQGEDLPEVITIGERQVSKVLNVTAEVIDNTQKNYDESVFQMLVDIFPDADDEFIKEQCCLHLHIDSVIEKILEMNNTYPMKKNRGAMIPGHQEISSDVGLGKSLLNIASSNTPFSLTHTNQLDFLVQIFPDADIQFLETKSKLNDTDLKEFISDALETRNYPKLCTSATIVKLEEPEDDLGLYTSSFDITKFLKVIKDPFTYYLDAKRECQKNAHSTEFMKRRYRKHSIKLIEIKFKEFKYNLSKTCEFLDSAQDSRSTKRSEHDIRMPPEVNLPFLQEACFVEHKKEIQDYLDNIKSDRQKAYDLAKTRGELIECGCCFEELIFEECATCNEGDLFCKTCIQRGAETRIGDGHTTFPCLVNCSSSFSLNLLQNLLEPQVFSQLLKRIQLDEVKAANIEGLEVCPFCEFATIPPPETKVFTCLNPECLKESCRQCHKVSHIPKRCDEVENDVQERARKYIEDEMTRALVRECYQCKRSFIKIDGCNKMTCSCGAKMCYICRQPVTDYAHFNGPGANRKNKCPLYSTEKLLHVDAVANIAKKALEKVKADNPDLQLLYDPSNDLPSSSSASTALPPGVEEAPAVLVERLNHFVHYNGAMMPRLNIPLMRRPTQPRPQNMPRWNVVQQRLPGPPAHAHNVQANRENQREMLGRMLLERRRRRGLPGPGRTPPRS